MSIICFANNKGGVGKTTSVLNLGAGMVLRGKKVLLVDYDGQSNLTSGLGFEKNTYETSIYDVIKGDTPPQEAILKRDDGIHLIPASKRLRSVEKEFAGDPEAYYYMQDPMDELSELYDFILIDCPPNIGYLTYSAIIATDEIYVPVKTEFFTLEGVNDLKEAIDKIRTRMNPRAKITGIFATMHSNEIRINKAVLQEFEKAYGDVVFENHIRLNRKLTEAQSYGEPIFEYDPKSIGAWDYNALCEEILKRNLKMKS